MGMHLGRKNGVLQLERTGPFVPDNSFPHPAIFSDRCKCRLEASGFTGIEFRPVRKARIVRLDWHLWDKSAPEPAEYPEEGEPEGYILDRPHDAKLSDQIGDFWELFSLDKTSVRLSATEIRELNDFSRAVEETQRRTAHYLARSNCDFYRPDESYPLYVSERVRDWINREFPESVRFVELPS